MNEIEKKSIKSLDLNSFGKNGSNMEDGGTMASVAERTEATATEWQRKKWKSGNGLG